MRRALLWIACLAATAAASAAIVPSFSRSLKPEDVKACGLDRLTKPEVAALDQLVQREDAVAASATAPLPAFSKRLTSAEFRAAGLDRLTGTQLGRIDDLVALREKDVFATTRWEVPAPAWKPSAGAPPPEVTVGYPAAEVHGSVTVGLGWGSGGYSERFGAVDWNYFDPAHGFGLAIGIEEDSVRGPGFGVCR